MKNRILLALLISLSVSLGCTQQDKANQALKDSIIKANEELLNKGNLDYADEVFAADYAGRGPVMIKEYISNLRTAFPDLQVKIEPIIAEGNKTAWRRIHTGTHQGEFMGFPASGKKITWEAIIISEYHDSKVSQEWTADNLLEVLQQERD